MGRKTPRLDMEPAPSPGDPVEPRAPLDLVPANSGPGNGPANPQANSGSASRARGASQAAFALEPAVADAEQEQSGAQERPAVQEQPDSPAGKSQIQSRVESRIQSHIQSQIQSIPSSAESAQPPWRIPLMVAVLAALAGGSALLYRQFFPSRPTPFREYRLRRLTDNQNVQRTAFAADGKSVLFSGGAGTAATIYSQPVAGSPARQIASLPGKLVMALRPSPDGTQLAFVAYAPQADAVILEDKRQ